MQKRFAAKSAPRFIVVESDGELRKILIEEIAAVTDYPVEGISIEDLSDDNPNVEAQIQLVFVREEKPRKPLNKNHIKLNANSVPNSMTGKTRPAESDLIAVVSHWEKFLELAKMFLLAARIAPETLLLRSANEADWRNGLQNVSLIICDSVTAKEFPNDNRVRVFQMIADSSLDEIRVVI